MNKSLLFLFFLKINLVLCNSERLDTTFGPTGNGTVVTQIGDLSQINAITMDQDNKIIVVGSRTTNNVKNLTIGRYSTDGTLDTSFGSNGIVITQIGTASCGNGVVIDSNQNIVICGFATIDGLGNTLIARYDSNGSLDTNFGTNGIVTTLIGDGGGAANSIVIDSNQKILIGTSAVFQGQQKAVVSRYTDTGSLDTTFGSSGSTIVSIGFHTTVNSIKLDSDEKIVAAGSTTSTNGMQFLIFRLDVDGSIDASFGTNGSTITDVPDSTFSTVNSIAIASTNNIIVGGYANDITTNLPKAVVASYISSGVLDINFGTNGLFIAPTNTLVNSIFMETSDRIVLGGAMNNQFLIARLNADGSVDNSFQVSITIGSDDQINSIMKQPDGKYVAGGYSNNQFAACRVYGDISNLVFIVNPGNRGTYLRHFIPLNGQCTAPNSSVNIYVDDLNNIFRTVPTGGGSEGNWDAGFTDFLYDGEHIIAVEIAGVPISRAFSRITVVGKITEPFEMGGILRVDKLTGSDYTGGRNTDPFYTINAAILKAQAGDTVWLMPGTYDEAITIPSYVAIKGISQNSCKISQTNLNADTTLVTMGQNSRLQDVTLELTSSNHVNLKGILFPSTTAQSAICSSCTLTVDNSSAGDGDTSNIYGVHSNGTGIADNAFFALKDCNIIVNSAGQGEKRAILVDAANSFNIKDINASVIKTGAGSGSYIGAQTNHASAQLIARNSYFAAQDADVSMTLGNLILNNTQLNNLSTNSLGFNSFLNVCPLIFADSGALPSNTTVYMRPGTATVSATEIKVRLPESKIIKSISVQALTAPGSGKTDTWTVRKNGIDTGMSVQLSDSELVKTNESTTVNFSAGDDLSIKLVTDTGTATADVVVVLAAY